MPIGLILVEWNERSGAEILEAIPRKVKNKIHKSTLMQVYNMHCCDAGSMGMTSLSSDNESFVSYFFGPEENRYLLLFLNMLENPGEFEKSLERVAKENMDEFTGSSYSTAVQEAFAELNEKEDL